MKRLFAQTFLTSEALLIAVELFRKVLVHSDQSDSGFDLRKDSLFKVFIVCYFIAIKYMDEFNFITASDAAYLWYSSEKTFLQLEVAILDEILDWKLVDLSSKDKNGQYTFLKWDYTYVIRSFLRLMTE